MRICFLLHEGRMQSGGQGIYLSNLARELSKRGHEVHAIVGPPYPELANGVQVHPVENYSFFRLLENGKRYFYENPPLGALHPLNFGELASSRLGMYSVMGAFSIRAYSRFRPLYEERPFDVVHDNQVLGYGTLLIRQLGVPVVATVHHPLDVDRANRIRQAHTLRQQVEAALFYPFFMQGLVARRLERIVAVSRTAAHSITDSLRLDFSRVVVVPDGVDIELFRPMPEVERRANRVLAVTNSEDRNKGIRYLLEAVGLLRNEGRDVELTLVDQPEWKLRLAPALAAELGLADRIRYTGPLSGEALAREYNATQVFVAPSLYEGFGLPAAEAMACGTAVVATAVGAAPELIEDGVSGALVPPADAGAIARAAGRLLDDPAAGRRLTERARGRIEAVFTWERVAAQLETVYEEAIAERRSQRSTGAAR